VLMNLFEARLQQKYAELRQIENRAKSIHIKEAREEYIVTEKANFSRRKDIDLADLENKLREFTSTRKIRPFFPWKLYFAEVFQEKGGYDVVIGNPPYIQLQKLRGNPLQTAYRNQNYQVHDSNGDIYCLFYEMGVNLLNKGGYLCYITSNKWMRAGYGEKLRAYFAQLNPYKLVDLGAGVFESATVDTNILLLQNQKNQQQLQAATFAKTGFTLSEFMKTQATHLPNIGKAAWFIGSDAEQRLKEKISQLGKPLKEWDVNIYRGIITGLNEAFIIDTATKERLCKEDEKSAEILKPLLRGRDIKRYSCSWAGLWLIASGFDIDVPKNYPAVYKHLLQFEEKANKRDDQGKNWWNLRACAYYPEFEREKVVWSDISTEPSFSLLPKGIYFNNTVYMVVGSYSDYFTSVLNSTVIKWYYPMIATGLGDKGQRFFKIFVEVLPIPPITPSNRKLVEKIEELVGQIVAAKKISTETSELEREIDALVYQLYELTPEEIAIVEKHR